MIGIIGAMGIEIEAIRDRMKHKKTETVGTSDYVSGTLHGKPVVTLVCGMGKVAAAMGAQGMILKYAPDCIINTGVGGSLSNTLNIGDIAVAESLVQHDIDTTPLGDPPGLISGLQLINIPADEKVTAALEQAAAALPVKLQRGVIASGDQFIANAEKKDWIVKQFGAIACEMEGAAIAQVCYANRVPFGVVRAASDRADGTGHMDYQEFLPQAAANAIALIDNFAAAY